MSKQLFLIGSVFLPIIGLWWLYFIEYRSYRMDHTRQRLFAIRDQLFQQWSEQGYDFDLKAYGITRNTLNGMIRFAHDLSLLRVIIVLITEKCISKGEHANQYGKILSDAITELPKPARKVILDARIEMHMALITHIVRSSIFLMLILEPIRLLLLTFHKWQFRSIIKSKRSRKLFLNVDAEANEIGSELATATT